jgi:hypothetical protein
MGQQIPQNARRIPPLSPAENLRVRSSGDSRVRRAFAKHHHAKTRWIHARNNFLHRQILGIGVALVGERWSKNRDHADGAKLEQTKKRI